MLQAAVRGVVDFRQAEPGERRWQQYLDIMLFGLVAEHRKEQRLLQAKYYLAAMQTPQEVEQQEHFREQAVAALRGYEDLLYPWAARERRKEETRSVEQLTNAWEAEFGRLDDPETQRGVEETVEALKEMRRERAEKRNRLAEARTKMLAKEVERREQRKREQRKRQ